MRELTEYNGYWFHPETCDKVKQIIANFSRNTRIRIFYGDTKTGKSWNAEYDVCGYIGRSTGTQKIPLLINNSNSLGGPCIFDHCIIGIVTIKGQWLYKHEKFNTGEWNSYTITDDDNDYNVAVACNHKEHARFKTTKQALNYIAFMKGERFSK